MRQPPAHVSRGRLVGAWTTALLASAVTVALASPAVGHDVLVGTDPADGAVLDAAPTQVVLTFAAEQAGVGAEVAVTGPDGTSWSDGAAVVAGTTVTQALAAGMPDGAYTVAWRSVAQDGHPVTGAFAFSLDAPDAEPTDQPADQPSDEPADAGADESTPSAEPTTVLTATAAADDEPSGGWTVWHTAAAALVAALAAGVAAVLRRSRRG